MSQDFKKIISAGLPALLTSDAGTGKTSVLRQFAKESNRKVVDLRVSMMPPEDLVGIPKMNNEKGFFEYIPPQWAVEDVGCRGDKLLIILEEIHLAPPATHAALYQLLQEKEVAGVSLDRSWIAATANPPEQAGSAQCADLPEALRDRLEIVDFKAVEIENEALVWLKNLASDLGVSEDIQDACGLDGLGLPITPRSCERLLRLISAGVTDEGLITRRAGPASSRVLNFLAKNNNNNNKTEDILFKASSQKRAKKNGIFTGEGFIG